MNNFSRLKRKRKYVYFSSFITILIVMVSILTFILVISHLSYETEVINSIDSTSSFNLIDNSDIRIRGQFLKHHDFYTIYIALNKNKNDVIISNINVSVNNQKLKATDSKALNMIYDSLFLNNRFDFVRYKFNLNEVTTLLNLNVKMDINSKEKATRRINKRYTFEEKSSLVIKSWDIHSDFFYPMIPYFIYILSFLIIMKMIITLLICSLPAFK